MEIKIFHISAWIKVKIFFKNNPFLSWGVCVSDVEIISENFFVLDIKN